MHACELLEFKRASWLLAKSLCSGKAVAQAKDKTMSTNARDRILREDNKT
jgi:hypothetical protein